MFRRLCSTSCIGSLAAQLTCCSSGLLSSMLHARCSSEPPMRLMGVARRRSAANCSGAAALSPAKLPKSLLEIDSDCSLNDRLKCFSNSGWNLPQHCRAADQSPTAPQHYIIRIPGLPGPRRVHLLPLKSAQATQLRTQLAAGPAAPMADTAPMEVRLTRQGARLSESRPAIEAEAGHWLPGSGPGGPAWCAGSNARSQGAPPAAPSSRQREVARQTGGRTGGRAAACFCVRCLIDLAARPALPAVAAAGGGAAAGRGGGGSGGRQEGGQGQGGRRQRQAL